MRSATVLGLAAVCLGGAPGAWAAYGARLDVSAEYRAQWAQQHAGDDLRGQDLTVGLGIDAPKTGVRGIWFSGLLHYDADLDGTAEDSPIKNVLDSYSRRDDFRLYRAALSYDLPAGWLRLTAGRQKGWSAEMATLDGGPARLTPCRWFGLELFGGQRVSFYRDREPDGVYGANLELRPFQTTLLQIKDLYYIDNSFQASLIQQLWGWGSGRVAYRKWAVRGPFRGRERRGRRRTGTESEGSSNTPS